MSHVCMNNNVSKSEKCQEHIIDNTFKMQFIFVIVINCADNNRERRYTFPSPKQILYCILFHTTRNKFFIVYFTRKK